MAFDRCLIKDYLLTYLLTAPHKIIDRLYQNRVFLDRLYLDRVYFDRVYRLPAGLYNVGCGS